MPLPSYHTELALFDRSLPSWLAHEEGKWVVLHGEEILGFFDSDPDAYRAGIEAYGKGPFLIRQVSNKPPLVTVPLVIVGDGI